MEVFNSKPNRFRNIVNRIHTSIVCADACLMWSNLDPKTMENKGTYHQTYIFISRNVNMLIGMK